MVMGYARYTAEFKITSAKGYFSSGLSLREYSNNIHVPWPTLYSWVKAYRSNGSGLEFVDITDKISTVGKGGLVKPIPEAKE